MAPFKFRRNRLVAACAAMLAAQVATASVSITGSYFTLGDPAQPEQLTYYLGNGVDDPPLGRLGIDGGSSFKVAAVNLGWNLGQAVAGLSGAGSTLNVANWTVGGWGSAVMNVGAGALLVGDDPSRVCSGQCGASIGSFAGASGVLTLSGAGSSASTRDTLSIASGNVFSVVDGNGQYFVAGTPGGSTSGTLQVLDGATFRSGAAQTGVYDPNGFLGNGTEARSATIQVRGPGSLWTLTGTSDPVYGFAALVTAGSAGSSTQLEISGGGRIQFDAPPNAYGSWANLGDQGGTSHATISGAGSTLAWRTGMGGALRLGQNGSSSFLDISAGGQVTGAVSLVVGGTNGLGVLNLSGAGSKILLDGQVSGGGFSGITVGSSGVGRLTLSQGALLELAPTVAGQFGPTLNVGSGSTGQGLLTITGAGSVLHLAQASVLPGGGSGEARNPALNIGRDGSATVLVSDGGKLLVEGNAISTPAAPRGTTVNIGGAGGTPWGGVASFTVSGAGSELRVTGSDAFIALGRGTGSLGQMTISAGAQVTSTVMSVGRQGGSGQLALDGGTLLLQGAFTGSSNSAVLGVGVQGGYGNVTLSNAAQLRVEGTGSATPGLNLGGSATAPGGSGMLSLNGGSSILLSGASSLPALNVAYDGTATLRVSGASAVDVGGGNAFVGRTAGAVGTLIVEGGSSFSAAWVGIGRDRSGNGDIDGGVGTLIVNDSTLKAGSIVIGSHGYLGGNGTLVGQVVNHGTFNPGNSPGTLLIDGGFSAATDGTLVLEIQADGQGHFATDRVLFTAGSTVDLHALNVQFHFLGSTDPSAFQASGAFGVDTFLDLRAADGTLSGLGVAAYDGARFSAVADAYRFDSFSFSATDGARFSTSPVPEPATGALLMAGLGLLATMTSRRQGRRASP